jgi:tetratricopeptide (TPR) repeat protein
MNSASAGETLPDFDLLWDYDNPVSTETKFRELLPIAQDSNTTSYHVQLLTQLARAQGLQRKFEDAHHTLNKAQSLLDTTDARTRIRYLLERGRIFNSSGEPAKARPLFLQAWELATSAHEDFYAIDAAHMIAIVEPQAKKKWNLKAFEIADASSEKRTRRWRGSLYNNIGWDYFESKEYRKALEAFKRALQAREEAEQIPEIRTAKWCIAKTLRVLGRVNEAMEMQERLLEEHEKSGQQDGYVYEEMAECLTTIGRQEEAKRYFAKAYRELSKDIWLKEKEPDRLKRLKKLSK